jgi:hypothetical protein
MREWQRLPVVAENYPSAVAQHVAQCWVGTERENRLVFTGSVRRYMEQRFIERIRQRRQSYDLNRAPDLRALRSDFGAFLKDELPALARLLVGLARDEGQSATKGQKPDGGPPPKERTVQRNTELLAFVAERVVEFTRLHDGELRPGRISHAGVPWQLLLEDWNESRERDRERLPSWEALKVRYYPAARSPHYSQRFLDDLHRECREIRGESRSEPLPAGSSTRRRGRAGAPGRIKPAALQDRAQLTVAPSRPWDDIKALMASGLKLSGEGLAALLTGHRLPTADEAEAISEVRRSAGAPSPAPAASDDPGSEELRVDKTEQRAILELLLAEANDHLTRDVPRRVWLEEPLVAFEMWRSSGSEHARTIAERPIRHYWWATREARLEAWLARTRTP